MKRVVWAPLLAMFVGAAAADYDQQARQLEQFVSENPVGARDYWLIIQNAMGEIERIALVHGMASDLDFCNTLVDTYRDRYPRARLFCEPAN